MSSPNSNTTEGIKIAEPGLLPEEWKFIPLGEILEEVDYRVRDSDTNDIPVLSMTRHQGLILQNEKFEKRVASRDVNNYKVVRKGHIVYGFPMDEGVIYTLRKFDLGAVSPVYEVWKLSSDIVDIDFLDELLRTSLMISTYRRLTSTTVQRRRIVSKRDFKRITVPLPSLPEQKAIARLLYSIRKSIEAQDNITAAARELKKSLMRHLFTYGPVPVAEAENVPIKETEIGLVPEHWEIVRLGEVVTQTQYGLSLRGQISGQYPILRMNNLVNGHVNSHGLQYVNLNTETFEKFRMNSGDLLFNRTNSHDLVGKTALFDLDDSYVFASYLIRIVTEDRRLLSRFANYYVNTWFAQARLKSLATRGVSQSNISASKLKGFLMPLPSLAEQLEIAQILSTVDSKIEAEENRKSALQALFKTMLHQLMTGKVRVKDLEATAA